MSFSNWKEVKISETITSSNTGLDAIKRAPIVDYDSGVKCLRIQDISQEKEFNEWGFCSVEDKNFVKFQLKKGDIIVARTGATIGVNKLIKKDLKAVYNNGLIRIKVNEGIINCKYLYYNMQTKRYKGHIQAICAGTSTQPNMKMNDLLYFNISLPPIEEQEVIANIFFDLDEKIEVNKQINKTLEAIAQEIFKHWFVDFEFPNENGEPYKSSGGEMVESGLGIIPKGWDEKPLYDFANYINGTSFQKDEYSVSGYPIIKIAELKNGITNSTQYFQGIKDEKYFIKNGDILFSWSGNPETSIDTFIWTGGDAILNQHTFKIGIINEDYAFVYLLLKFFKPEFTRIASRKQTTGLGHVTVNDLRRLKFQYDREIILSFCNLINPVLQDYINNLFENQKLSSIRDELLPKLMSGEIRVALGHNGIE